MRIEVSDLLIWPNEWVRYRNGTTPAVKGAIAKLGTVYDHFVPEPYEK